MDIWHQYTARANTEYQLSFYGNAILMHNQALDFARHHFADHLKACVHHAIARVLISHFSLADCYYAIAEFERAADCYLDAQRFLLRCHAELPCTEITVHAIQHAVSHLHALWCELLRQHQTEVCYTKQVKYYQSSNVLRQLAMRAEVMH
jgi:tetratricopeptide (TPR) repeat protein